MKNEKISMGDKSRKQQWLLWGLPLSGLFYLFGVVVRGNFADPMGAPEVFADKANSIMFAPAYFSIIIASGLELIGYIGLRERLNSKFAVPAMILSIIGLHFLTAFFGVMAITYPAIGAAFSSGQLESIQIAANFFKSSVTLMIVGLASANVAGHMLFALDLWKTSWAPKPAIVGFAIAPIMQCLPMIYSIEIMGCALVMVTGLLIVFAAKSEN